MDFRFLTFEEEKEFRQWARDNKPEKEVKEYSALYHPVILDEWKKLGYKEVMKAEKELDRDLRNKLVDITNIYLIRNKIVVEIRCLKDGERLMKNEEGKYYKCLECGSIWSWEGGE